MPTLAEDNAIRKAAVLIRSLDGDAAAAVLARLSADEAKALRAAVRELGDVSDDERQSVADALRAPAPPSPSSLLASDNAGVELAISSSSINEPPLPEAARSPRPTADTPADTLRNLADADADTLLVYLRHEQPQTVAVVLSCLAPPQAAAVLAALPSDQRPLVLDRLADLGEADPESLHVITSGLRDWINEQQRRRSQRTQRLDTIAAILSAAGDDDRQSLLESAGDRAWRQELAPRFDNPSTPAPVAQEPEVAAAPEPTPAPVAPSTPPLLIAFADVERLPAAALAQVLRHTPAEHLLLALAGGSETLLRKITTALPRRQAASLRKRLTQIGPTRLRDIEQAQDAVARAASELLRRGWIAVGAPSR